MKIKLWINDEFQDVSQTYPFGFSSMIVVMIVDNTIYLCNNSTELKEIVQKIKDLILSK